MRRFVRDNALSLTVFGFFLVFWAAQSVNGWHAANATTANTISRQSPIRTT